MGPCRPTLKARERYGPLGQGCPTVPIVRSEDGVKVRLRLPRCLDLLRRLVCELEDLVYPHIQGVGKSYDMFRRYCIHLARHVLSVMTAPASC